MIAGLLMLSLALNGFLLDRWFRARGDADFDHTWMNVYRKKYDNLKVAAFNYFYAIEGGNPSAIAGTRAYLKPRIDWRDK